MQWFKNNQKKVATEITNSMGKPLNQSMGEVDGMIKKAEGLYDLSRTALEDDIIQVDSESFLKIKMTLI